MLEHLGMRKGIEIGVERGDFAKHTLSRWPSCVRYVCLDAWRPLKNYVDDANVNADAQQANFDETREKLKPWAHKVEFVRALSSEAVDRFHDGEFDYAYVDARHDFVGVMEDLENYYPKVRPGGILAGHDYVTAAEAFFHGGATYKQYNDWTVGADGTVASLGSHAMGAVKAAVDLFAQRRGLQVIVTYRENMWNSWYLRKPAVLLPPPPRGSAVGPSTVSHSGSISMSLLGLVTEAVRARGEEAVRESVAAFLSGA
jgi:hypothetical protein